GVNRIIAAAIELNNDKKGIIWPSSIAPFHVIIVPINYDKENVRKVADQVYTDLQKKGIEVLLDDRNESAGVKFNDAELIGIPFQVVIGERALKKGVLELKDRTTGKITELKPKDLISKLSPKK
ncbi:MAG: proline--tRNA ligase, partial [Candidatus Omnitrophica bacterium]|nr:proline--tRNA ligase [Candidatus Omnitrophota bacterium]